MQALLAGSGDGEEKDRRTLVSASGQASAVIQDPEFRPIPEWIMMKAHLVDAKYIFCDVQVKCATHK